MPVGSRVRANNVFGLVADNPLAAAVTTFSSEGLENLPEIVLNVQHALITLDPLRIHGDPEIIVVTAHASGADSATITRAAYGTATRAHPQGTMWMHSPIGIDYIGGIVGYTQLTTSTGPYNDWEQVVEFDTPVDVIAGHTYKATIHGIMNASADSTWNMTAWFDGPHGVNMSRTVVGAASDNVFNGVGVWTADGTETKTFEVFANLYAGTGTVQFMEHNDAISFVVIEDIGIIEP